MANFGSAAQDVGTIQRRNRNDLLQRAVSSVNEHRERAIRHRDEWARPRLLQPGRSAPKRPDLLLVLVILTPHSTNRSTRTCSTRKETNDHPSRVAAVRMVETAPPSLAGSNGRLTASKHSQARPRPAANTKRAEASEGSPASIAIWGRQNICLSMAIFRWTVSNSEHEQLAIAQTNENPRCQRN